MKSVNEAAQDFAPDDEFLEQLLGHIPSLRLYARVLARNSSAADDLVQDALLRAMEKHHLWRRGTNLGAWLKTVMRHVFIDSCRAKKSVPLDDGEDYMPELAVAAEQTTHMELRRIGAALDNMRKEHREVLVLVAVEGVPYEEAAGIVGVEVGTIRSRLSRARELLRQELESDRRYPARRRGGYGAARPQPVAHRPVRNG